MVLTPDEAIDKKKDYLESASWIPPVVFEAFGEMIIERLDENGCAKFNVDTIVKLILSKNKTLKRDTIFNEKMLDVEPRYRKAGWSVVFNKEPYYSTSPSYFIFEKKKT